MSGIVYIRGDGSIKCKIVDFNFELLSLEEAEKVLNLVDQPSRLQAKERYQKYLATCWHIHWKTPEERDINVQAFFKQMAKAFSANEPRKLSPSELYVQWIKRRTKKGPPLCCQGWRE
ncbi:MAG: hypothetical protein KR126chlam3_00949 [Chlamydiae bacterium]|nr:hypothetical protein [Chlamydiota bacterium]